MEMMVNARRRGEELYGGGGHHHNLGLGLGLSLSLGIATAAAPAPVVETSSPSPPPKQQQQQRALSVAPISSSIPAPQPPPQQQSSSQCWKNGFFFSAQPSGMDRSTDRKQQHQQPSCHEMPFLRGIDVNRAPGESRRCSEEDDEEDPGASSPNSTLSCSLSGKRGAPARSGGGGDLTPRGPGGGGSDDEDSGGGGGSGSRKKLRLSKDQAAVLEESFKEHNTLNPKQKAALAKQLNLKPRQVEVWFQNRRARTKLKQTEVDCEILKRCCESLTEENRRLQREVAELRALKLVPAAYYARAGMAPPPATLTMCPSCERVAAASADEARAARPAGPWGPVPVRPVFVDGPARRS